MVSRKKAARAKKAKPERIDGLGPQECKLLVRAVRQAWQWSHAWRLVKKRTMHEDGFPRCENKRCPKRGKPVPKIFVDHISPVGGPHKPHYIKRMFVPSSQLQGLCKKCHDAKTKADAESADFY